MAVLTCRSPSQNILAFMAYFISCLQFITMDYLAKLIPDLTIHYPTECTHYPHLFMRDSSLKIVNTCLFLWIIWTNKKLQFCPNTGTSLAFVPLKHYKIYMIYELTACFRQNKVDACCINWACVMVLLCSTFSQQQRTLPQLYGLASLALMTNTVCTWCMEMMRGATLSEILWPIFTYPNSTIKMCLSPFTGHSERKRLRNKHFSLQRQ